MTDGQRLTILETIVSVLAKKRDSSTLNLSKLTKVKYSTYDRIRNDDYADGPKVISLRLIFNDFNDWMNKNFHQNSPLKFRLSSDWLFTGDSPITESGIDKYITDEVFSKLPEAVQTQIAAEREAAKQLQPDYVIPEFGTPQVAESPEDYAGVNPVVLADKDDYMLVPKSFIKNISATISEIGKDVTILKEKTQEKRQDH